MATRVNPALASREEKNRGENFSRMNDVNTVAKRKRPRRGAPAGWVAKDSLTDETGDGAGGGNADGRGIAWSLANRAMLLAASRPAERQLMQPCV